jgi:acyl dehydratase
MSEIRRAGSRGEELISAPYQIDDKTAAAYIGAIEAPGRRRPATIHNDLEAACRAGFRAPIVAGEHSLAVLTQFLADCFEIRFLRGGRFQVAFIKPVFIGDRLTAHVRVVSSAAQATTLEVWVQNDEGERVLTGTATIPADAE